MKPTAFALLAAAAGTARASLNCTVVAPVVTLRDCEWDGCAAHATATAGAVLHAGCRADCSTQDDPWLKLYDGTYVRTNDALANCRYFCEPYAITGLPTCAWEHNETDPGPGLAFCAASSLMGVATTKLLGPSTLGTEPPAFSGVATAGTACDWTKTPATLSSTTTTTGLAGKASAKATATGFANGTATTNSTASPPTTPAPSASMHMFRRHGRHGKV
ncbi:hypothetical protein SPI_05791 [Niveomyces insectorum RCEF 264]|uniref:Uncharacterized protein n=1 Tax=Niveomyces insectorum RCEF 264 TaxID=1081102 RepID=A0A167SFY9_9HYPO|nr:hypothetical protein SPI_05791 [Niveomyces insectorum RCEF 264]